MAYTETRVLREGGNGTGYRGEVTNIADYPDVPNNSYFKHRGFIINPEPNIPDTDVVLFKDGSGNIVDPAELDYSNSLLLMGG